VAYVNGGHEPPRIVHAAGGVRAMLPPTGPAVGMLPEIPFTAGSITLAIGETLLILTDGVTESRAPNGLLLGDDATDALLLTPAATAEALLERLLDAVHVHAAEAPAADDVTLLAVKRV
jgi:sigma-B regulation protein RsbU (phosphoserine phosphatase)